MTRFRDVITGWFTTKADTKLRPEATVEETANSLGDRAILREALFVASKQDTDTNAYTILADAVHKVLKR